MLNKLYKLYVKTFPINSIQRFIKVNWKTFTILEKYIGLTIKRWKLDNIEIVHSRQIRGDLIEVFLDKKLIISYVDQTYQYGPLLGVGNIMIDITDNESEILYLNISKIRNKN